MRKSLLLLVSLVTLLTLSSFQADVSLQTRLLLKPLLALFKWVRKTSPKPPQNDGNAVQFENGYLVETIVEGNQIGILPHSIRLAPDGELFAVDSINSNIMRITPPLSQYSRARLVAGSFQGYSGHVDGKPSDARFNHPKGLTVDGRGNIYVADTENMAIRKIGESGVTTIAGGKSNMAGYADGPSEEAKFSGDFDLFYDGSSCSLIVVDRGNAALRQIHLHGEECSDQHDSVLSSDILMIVGAILVGYVTCLLQDGFAPTQLFKMLRPQQKAKTGLWDEQPVILDNSASKPKDWWLSISRVFNKFESIPETLSSIFFYPLHWLRRPKSRDGLHPLRDRLKMPEDDADSTLLNKQRHSWTVPETQQLNSAPNDYAEQRPSKIKPSGLKDHSTSAKLRSSRRKEFPDFYGSGEASQHSLHASKNTKERTRHRYHDKAREVVFGAVDDVAKPMEIKAVDYGDPRFDRYNVGRKFGGDDDRFQF